MPRKVPRPVIPDRETVHQRAGLARRWLGEDELWHLGRQSVARTVSVCCVWALLPLPIQTSLALLPAVFFRANLPIIIVAVWISNPLAMIPLYWTGCLLMSILGQLLSYYLVNTLWRVTVLRNRRNRNQPIGKV